MVGLNTDVLRNIKQAFEQVPAIEKALIYGSRAKGNYKTGSDIDITLIGKNLNPDNSIYPLIDLLDALYLPYQFDISIFDKLDKPEFISQILRAGKTLYEKESGKLPVGWVEKKLGDVCKFQNGFAFKSKLFTETGMPILRITNIQSGSVDLKRIVYTDPSSYKEDLDKYRVVDGDLLIAMSGATTGKIGINKTGLDFLLNQRLGKFIPEDRLDNQYLYYYLSTKVEEHLEISAGAAQPNLSTEQIKEIQIPLPPSPEQKRIVAVLDQAFTAIDLARTKIEQNLKNARELFESYLQQVFSQRGDGWVEKRLGETVVVERGSSPRPIKSFRTDSEEGVNWVKIGDAREGEKYINFTKEKITKEGAEKSRFVDVGDFILSNSMSFGHPYIMNIQGYIHDGWFVLRLPYNINPDYFYYLLSSPYLKGQFNTLAAGAIVKNISGDLVKQAVLPIPPIDEQKKIASKLDLLALEINKLESFYQSKSISIDELKKAILQKAFKGEL